VLAKAPTPGLAKTRLCPPCTHRQAAHVAEAALLDTLDAVDAAPLAARRVLIVAGESPLWSRPGWEVVGQRGDRLGERIANAFVDSDTDVSLLIGMDTPQVTGGLLARCAGLLGDAGARADAVLGPAIDGGWWLLGLRDPSHASMLAGIPTSRPDTGARTRAALVGEGLRVARAPRLRDVDTAADARAVAARCGGRFADAVGQHVPAPVAERA